MLVVELRHVKAFFSDLTDRRRRGKREEGGEEVERIGLKDGMAQASEKREYVHKHADKTDSCICNGCIYPPEG